MKNNKLNTLLTIFIPTINEEEHLPRALESVLQLNVECFVVDSHSSDKTTQIAEQFGCKVVQGEWSSFSEKLNWALENLPVKTPWIMRLDADERLTSDLIEKLSLILPTLADDVAGVWVNRRLVHLGRWIKHGACYPNKSLRIFKKGRAIHEARLADEKVILNGPAYDINEDIIDEPMRGMLSWSAKHLMYAKTESSIIIQKLPTENLGRLERVDRYKRFAQQNIYYRLPLFLRAFMYWFYRYFIRLGFLDGKEGFLFHFLQAFWYRFFVDVLIFESKIADKKLRKNDC